jgi:hypothetical protein
VVVLLHVADGAVTFVDGDSCRGGGRVAHGLAVAAAGDVNEGIHDMCVR